MTDGARGWSRAPFGAVRFDAADLDLRVSASRLRLAATTIDDAALSVMTRGDRLEVDLGQGKAYGGMVKGRVSVGPAADGLGLHGTGALAGADLAALGWDAAGRQVAAGTLSASFMVDAAGDSAAALVRSAQGWARAAATDGEVSGLGGAPWSASARTPFKTLAVGARIADGRAVLQEGGMEGFGTATALTGTADLAARRLDLRARIRAADAPERQVRIGGSFDDVAVDPADAPDAAVP